MAGHSKWANIRHKKGRADAKRGKLFTRAAKEIISAVKTGGADPKTNARLRLAIQRAKAVNFPNDSIERNIKKGCSADQADYTATTYELYGYGGVGLIVEALTDNRNRTVSDLRIATNKRGGTIAQPGAVSFNFVRCGWLEVPKAETDEEALFLLVTEAGAEEFFEEGDCFAIITPADQLFSVREAIEEAGIKCTTSELRMLPKTVVGVDAQTAEANVALIEWLEGIDDVDSVYHNMAPPQ